MTTFYDIQTMLDRVLGDADPGNHGAFWRGKTRDEFVASSEPGLPIIVVGEPENSNLVKALRGLPPFGADLNPRPSGAFIRRMPAGRPPASEEDIRLLEEWIAAGCPDDIPGAQSAGLASNNEDLTIDDFTHVRYWNYIDHFFLPSLASDETLPHVLKLHLSSFGPWQQSKVQGADESIWKDHMALQETQESFQYIRLHQRRIINDFYGSSQTFLFDSLWKFGGDLLPEDNDPQLPRKRTMNSVLDWFYWIPYTEMALLAPDRTEVDLDLAKAWQIGFAADGLVRGRVEIPDFDPNAAALQQEVTQHYVPYAIEELISGMESRARNFLNP